MHLWWETDNIYIGLFLDDLFCSIDSYLSFHQYYSVWITIILCLKINIMKLSIFSSTYSELLLAKRKKKPNFEPKVIRDPLGHQFCHYLRESLCLISSLYYKITSLPQRTKLPQFSIFLSTPLYLWAEFSFSSSTGVKSISSSPTVTSS